MSESEYDTILRERLTDWDSHDWPVMDTEQRFNEGVCRQCGADASAADAYPCPDFQPRSNVDEVRP